MGLLEHVFWKVSSSHTAGNAELPEIYSLNLVSDWFIKHDVIEIYKKILTDCIERTHGLEAKHQATMWDSCVRSDASKGMITLLAEAMEQKADLFLVYKANVLRIADAEEQKQIKQDYSTQGQSPVGVYISFANYDRTTLLKIYSGLEYCALDSLNTSMNLSKALQMKMAKLRDSVGTTDSGQAESQAKSMAEALKRGKNILMDKDDEIATAKVDMDATDRSIAFCDNKRSLILGLPKSYFSGDQTTGIGTTGEADAKAVERGLRPYFLSILKPALNALFGVEVSYKSEDFRTLTSGLDAVRTFELITSDDLLDKDDQRRIVRKLFGLEENEQSS